VKAAPHSLYFLMSPCLLCRKANTHLPWDASQLEEHSQNMSDVVTAIRKIISWLSNRANFTWKNWEENNKELHLFSEREREREAFLFMMAL